MSIKYYPVTVQFLEFKIIRRKDRKTGRLHDNIDCESPSPFMPAQLYAMIHNLEVQVSIAQTRADRRIVPRNHAKWRDINPSRYATRSYPSFQPSIFSQHGSSKPYHITYLESPNMVGIESGQRSSLPQQNIIPSSDASPASSLGFFIHSQDTLNEKLSLGAGTQPSVRQKRRRTRSELGEYQTEDIN